MRSEKRRILIYALMVVIAIMFTDMNRVLAADAEVVFGSEEYEHESGEEFPIGLYINTEEGYVGRYHIELEYDSKRIEYIDGADIAQEGRLTFEGDGDYTQSLMYWLTFRAISGGEAYIKIISAEIEILDSETGEIYNITRMADAPIYLEGEDTAAIEEERLEQERLEQERLEEERLEQERLEQERLEEERLEQERLEQERLEQERLEKERLEKERLEKEQQEKEKNEKMLMVIAVVIIVDLIIFIIIIRLIIASKKEKKRRIEAMKRKNTAASEEQAAKEMATTELSLDLNGIYDDLEHWKKENELQRRYGSKPVIRIKDVTMEFKIATSNVSGLKEYVIQKVKKKISYRKLLALDHISFNVYKGEVIGIIGTNGSGKSTLLRLVSGALNPTSGRILVDRSKVQLLTLGTGFDMELTARENVYLNGSIIGYTKEFLDKHYDEIVEFAELEDFMEEKVKNFSSGMVSRLGFAIATAGAAAEILILDEVLSVGDEFFRKKSLARIKEMIHGGSTVLMVSHGMGTILENCTRVVWIEKGVLRMVGEPKVVCEAYRKLI